MANDQAMRAEVEALKAQLDKLTRGASGPPRGQFTVTDVEAYVHCTRADTCPSYVIDGKVGEPTQRPVIAQLETFAQTYGQRGGDLGYEHLTENTWLRLFFADSEQYKCPDCGEMSLEISEHRRPVYKRESERDPLALLKLHRGTATEDQVIAEAKKAAGATNPEIAALENRLAVLAGYLVGAQQQDGKALPPELAALLTVDAPKEAA